MASSANNSNEEPTQKPGDKYYDTTCLYNHTLLGPKDLEESHVPNALLQNYKPFGSLTAKKFLDRWWHEKDPAKDDDKSDWLWPNYFDGGYLLDNGQAGHPIRGHITLQPGTLIDRFGDEDTRYFCPVGTPFMMRSLGPDMLKNPTTDPNIPEHKPYRYRVYRVKQALTVEAGPIEPGFEQMGMGTQFISKDKNAATLTGDKTLEKLSDDEIAKLYA